MESVSVNKAVVLLTGNSVYQTRVNSKRQARATPTGCVVKINQWMKMNVRNCHCCTHKLSSNLLGFAIILSEEMVSL
jgi:hypothetical protein